MGISIVNVSDIGNGDVLVRDGVVCLGTAYYGNVASDGKRHTSSIYIKLNCKDLQCNRPKLGPSHSFNETYITMVSSIIMIMVTGMRVPNIVIVIVNSTSKDQKRVERKDVQYIQVSTYLECMGSQRWL